MSGADGPPLAWTLRGYRPDQLPRDVVAGLTVTALHHPPGDRLRRCRRAAARDGVVRVAGTAGGLCHLRVGATADRRPGRVDAALIGVTIAPLAAAADDRVRLASALGLMVAGLFVAMRLGRMGFLADLLSRPSSSGTWPASG